MGAERGDARSMASQAGPVKAPGPFDSDATGCGTSDGGETAHVCDGMATGCTTRCRCSPQLGYERVAKSSSRRPRTLASACNTSEYPGEEVES